MGRILLRLACESVSPPATPPLGPPSPPSGSGTHQISFMKAFLQFSERFGTTLRILLTVLYFLVLGPFALLYQLFADPLRLRKKSQGKWLDWERPQASLQTARKQD